jgi:hypothetical protein
MATRDEQRREYSRLVRTAVNFAEQKRREGDLHPSAYKFYSILKAGAVGAGIAAVLYVPTATRLLEMLED